MDNKLFNKEDILTTLTTDKAKIGDKGYFGDSLARLATEVERGEVHVLAKIYDEDFTLYPFKGDHAANCFALFLPADKVKKSLYRPLKTFAELFSFFMTDIENQKIDRHQKAQLLMGEQNYTKKKRR